MTRSQFADRMPRVFYGEVVVKLRRGMSGASQAQRVQGKHSAHGHAVFRRARDRGLRLYVEKERHVTRATRLLPPAAGIVSIIGPQITASNHLRGETIMWSIPLADEQTALVQSLLKEVWRPE